MKKERYKANVTVGLLLIQDAKVLLEKRQNTDFEEGKYGLVSGHLEEGETLKEAIIREAKEEVGIFLTKEELTFIGTFHFSNDNYLNFYFTTSSYKGNAQIKEPDKCSKLKWVEFNQLPEMVPQDKKMIENYLTGRVYYEEYEEIGEIRK